MREAYSSGKSGCLCSILLDWLVDSVRYAHSYRSPGDIQTV